MITRGRERVGEWTTPTTEQLFKPKTLYELVYTVEIERAWWTYIFWFIKFKPDKFAEVIPQEIEKEAGIPQDEIHVCFWAYDEELSIFRVQFKWIPIKETIEPGIAVPIALIVKGVIIAIPFVFTYLTLRIIGKPTLQEIKEFVTEAVNKTLIYLDVLAGVVCFAYLTPLFMKKSRKEK